MEIIINLLSGFLSAYVVYEYYRVFFEVKKNSILVKGMLITYVVWQMISMPSLFNIPAVIRLVLSISFVFLIGVCFDGSRVVKVVFAIIYNAIWVFSELLVSSFFLMEKIDISENSTLGAIVCEAYLLLLVKLLQLFFKHGSMRNFSWKYNGILMMIPIGFTFFSYQLFLLCSKVGTSKDIILSVVVFILLMISMFVIFFMYIKLIDSYEINRKNEIYKLELALHTEYIKEKESLMTEFKKAKHDLKHNLLYIMELSNNGEYVKLEQYIRDIANLRDFENISIANTDNTIIDAFINHKYEIAKKQGIKFDVELNIPYNMGFDNGDLCIVLGNALDNALEANEDKNINQRYINLMMRYDKGNLIIIVENTFDGKFEKRMDGTFVTKKKDKWNHGIGLSSIKSVLVKYDGDMDVEIKDSIYKLSMVMYSNR